MNQYVNRKFSKQYKATIGADFLTREVQVDDASMADADLGHRRPGTLPVPRRRLLPRRRLRVLCYDVNTPKTFENLENWRDEFLDRGESQRLPKTLSWCWATRWTSTAELLAR